MIKKIISTEKSPAAIGPYNQGIVAGGFLYTSGQLPINPATGEVPATIKEQTVQVLDNLKAIIEAAGCTMEHVVKCTVYIQHMDDFAAMNEVYSTYFPANPPARACIEVSKMAKNALVEIDATVVFLK
jgi:2-iminobutanoate/2-iminopropanoate deaminase